MVSLLRKFLEFLYSSVYCLENTVIYVCIAGACCYHADHLGDGLCIRTFRNKGCLWVSRVGLFWSLQSVFLFSDNIYSSEGWRYFEQFLLVGLLVFLYWMLRKSVNYFFIKHQIETCNRSPSWSVHVQDSFSWLMIHSCLRKLTLNILSKAVWWYETCLWQSLVWKNAYKMFEKKA